MPDEDTTASTGPAADGATTEPAPEAGTTTTSTAPAVEDDTDDDLESTLDPKARAALEKVRREARNLRTRLKDLEPAAAELKKIRDRDKTESQRLADQITELQAQVLDYQLTAMRTEAATAAGLPAGMAQFITATTPADAKAQAKQLAEFGRLGQQGAADFRQGARPAAATRPTGDELIRRMAGRQ